jgi:hypothetical protein
VVVDGRNVEPALSIDVLTGNPPLPTMTALHIAMPESSGPGEVFTGFVRSGHALCPRHHPWPLMELATWAGEGA